jgi:phosphoserine phosphatase RsbU/P
MNECFKLAAGGLAIGMFEFSRYEEETIQLQSGDLIVAYTDGVTEALNAAGEELGETRLCEAMAVFADRSAKETMDGIAKRLQQWCCGVVQYDDLTMIVLKVR